jgi:hypothetical protein
LAIAAWRPQLDSLKNEVAIIGEYASLAINSLIKVHSQGIFDRISSVELPLPASEDNQAGFFLHKNMLLNCIY